MTIAVGFFDGVHRGHQAILAGADIAVTFANHPLSLLAPERAPGLIMTPADREAAIRACGVPRVEMLPFDAELAALTPENFLTRLRALSDGGPLAIRCGANWRFGKGGSGDAAWLRARGVDVTVVPYATHANEPISSSRIRRALADGKIEDAAAMTGRPVTVRGEVFAGKGLGRQIGFPTVNLRLPQNQAPLPRGVYVVEAGNVRGVANYGLAPTMGENAWSAPVMEIHFLGKPPADVSRVTLIRFLRPERKFDSLAALKTQIASDIAAATVRDA